MLTNPFFEAFCKKIRAISFYKLKQYYNILIGRLQRCRFLHYFWLPLQTVSQPKFRMSA